MTKKDFEKFLSYQKYPVFCTKGFQSLHGQNLVFQELRKQVPGCSVKKGAIKNFAIFTGKHLCCSLFLIKRGLQACNFIEKRLQHRCFPVNIAKFLRTPISSCLFISPVSSYQLINCSFTLHRSRKNFRIHSLPFYNEALVL